MTRVVNGCAEKAQLSRGYSPIMVLNQRTIAWVFALLTVVATPIGLALKGGWILLHSIDCCTNNGLDHRQTSPVSFWKRAPNFGGYLEKG